MGNRISLEPRVEVDVLAGESIFTKTTANFKNVLLTPNIVNGVNLLTQEMIDEYGDNTKFVIKTDYILDGTITLPENCIIEFDGGSFDEGVLVGNDTKIINLYDYDVLNSTEKQGTFKMITAILEI